MSETQDDNSTVMASANDDGEKKDAEKQVANHKDLPYPKSIFFIVSNEFCERFSYYGMRTILSLYMADFLDFGETTASVIYHAFVALCYFTPVIGAILADSFLGKFRTIFYISIIYAIGQIVLTVGATDFSNDLAVTKAISFIGLALIALGTGGIKPCVVSFGAEQFQLPEQESKMKTYFSLFYASINAGSLISTILTPILRDLKCGGSESCFPAAFGVPAGLMIVAIMFFLGGRLGNMYKMVMPKENILVKVSSCIWHAFTEKRARGKHDKSNTSMLDYAAPKYGKAFIEDVRAVLNVLYMFLPFPLFWALFDQQGSRWTFQARHMNGETFGFIILPDQMQVANPVLILAFIPVFEYAVYPLFAKFGLLTKPLQRIVTGGSLAAVAFFMSGGLELILQQHYPDLPGSGETHMTLYNGLPKDCFPGKIKLDFFKNGSTEAQPFEFDLTNSKFAELNVPADGQFTVPQFTASCGGKKIAFEKTTFEPLEPGKEEVANTHVLLTFNHNLQEKGIVKVGEFIDPIDKSSDGLPEIKFIWNTKAKSSVKFQLYNVEAKSIELEFTSNSTVGDYEKFHIETIDEYEVRFFADGANNYSSATKVNFKFGANYQLLLIEGQELVVHQITEENVYHIFWILPQYVVMTAGEVMFSITGLTFAFTQAPDSMRAVLQSAYTVTTGFGNLIDVILLSLLGGVFESQAYEFFLFASLMVLDMLLLAWMATKYKYVNYTGEK